MTFIITDADTLNNRNEAIQLKEGESLFILGANGTGKSALMHKIYVMNYDASNRISAHRQTWFTSNSLDVTPSAQERLVRIMQERDRNADSRYRDHHHNERTQTIIFDLINSENLRSRIIANAVDNNDMGRAVELSAIEAPLRKLNNLLKLSNLPIVIKVENDDKVVASKNGSPSYSIAELSDGERNAIFIAAKVLTSNSGTLFLIDEPERHLHRAITSPLLSSLFEERPDCAFVIATHDLMLPLDNPDSNVLAVRECIWQGSSPSKWDADYISATDEINYQIKQDILGSKRVLLFVEGAASSLDQYMYQILFPNVSVRPQGSCSDVERSVKGILDTESLHWAEAFGIIDGDDRSPEEIEELKGRNIFALPCYSVESIYYSEYIITKIADRQVRISGEDRETLVQTTFDVAISAIKEHRDRLCSRLCERKVREMISLPTWKEILNDGWTGTNISTKSELNLEKRRFNVILESDNSFNQLIQRYPVRETSALAKIADNLGFKNRTKYENAVRKMLTDDEDVRDSTRNLLGELSTAISPERAAPEQTQTAA